MEKNQEKPKQMNKLRSHFYPKDYEGSEEAAYQACKNEAGKSDVFWDEVSKSFYYYPPFMIAK